MDERLSLIREISELPGVPGYEDEVPKYIELKMQGLSQVARDNIGSVICKKTGASESPRIMMAAHMDEIGMMVTYITKEGFLKFQTLGAWWEQVMLAQRVTVRTSTGDVLGIIGSKPPRILKTEERNKIADKSQMFIDIGASSKEDAERMGVLPGDPVVPVSPFAEMKDPKYLLGKAWDDRIGCAVFMEVIRNLQGLAHPNTVYGVGTVQEEVGLRGATTSVSMVEPEIGFALEADIPGDTPGVQEHEAQSKFHIYRNGVPSLVVGVPARYVHSHAGIVHRDDFDAAITLVTEVVKRLDGAAAQAIKGQ